jgi:hypothetical protein
MSSNTAAHGSAQASMASYHGVRKKANQSNQKKKRGRPKTYSDSWTKKLIVLRMCGLHLSEIVQLLSIQGGSNFGAK